MLSKSMCKCVCGGGGMGLNVNLLFISKLMMMPVDYTQMLVLSQCTCADLEGGPLQISNFFKLHYRRIPLEKV